MVAVEEAARAGHAVSAAGASAGGVGCSAASDHVFAGPFDLAAADAAAFAQAFGVVQVMGMGGEIISQLMEGRWLCSWAQWRCVQWQRDGAVVESVASGFPQGFNANPAVMQQGVAREFGPGECATNLASVAGLSESGVSAWR